MKINDEFEKMIYDKYYEMKSSNITEDFINNKSYDRSGGLNYFLGEIKIFINSKPEYCLIVLKIENDNIYIGV